MSKVDPTTFFPIPKIHKARRLSLGKQLGILLVIVLFLFISVGYVLQNRLEQTQSMLNDLTINTIPAMNRATRSALKSSELLSALESLTSATTAAERRIAELEVAKKLDESSEETHNRDKTELLLLKAIQGETQDINLLIDQKLDLNYQIKNDLNRLWELKKLSAEVDRSKQVKASEKEQIIQWKTAFLEIIGLAYRIETTERLSDLQEIHRALERELKILNDMAITLSGATKETIQSINISLENILSVPENLTEQQANYLRITGRVRGREHFIRNMINDYSNITNQLSLNEHTSLHSKTERLSQDMQSQKIWFISGFLLLAGMVIATLALYSHAIKRLRKLTQKIHQMTTDSNDSPSNMDEIDELFKAFDEFSETIDAQTQRLEALSLTDSLTNIANRRAFDLRLAEELSPQKNGQYDFSILLIDVDYFKQYNDTYGHISGDKALQKIASVLESVLHEETDLIARYGGEEFVVILANKDAAQAKLIAHNMKQAISLANIEHRTNKVFHAITISVGIVTKLKNTTTNTDTLIKQADTALYYSKNRGRDRSTHINDITS
ncbi:diguanylate cyclase domain-containing protein [Marinomonas sp.]|uniref:GGDEF domain-containing protein n=1 Tax=Marinomonas sp. TaxID=1904862 RepID=UPI003BAB3CED